MTKHEKLAVLKKEMEMAKLPLKGKANLVFGEGNPDCSVLFIGEAPGFTEDMQKRPFVGRSGQLLDKLIVGINWQRKDVYITNIVKRRPPENRDPSPEEIEAYRPYLARQIEILNPKIIATLGRFSMNYFLPLAKISNDHGKVHQVEGRIVFPLFHPAAAMRATHVMEDLQADFKKLPAVIAGKSPSSAPGIAQIAKKIEKPAQTKLF
ncbi:MAG: uracil-DNA glycosylase [Patescibacteria group bacterium]